jgi:hypothetical protein
MLASLSLLSVVLSTMAAVDISIEAPRETDSPVVRGVLIATPALKQVSSDLGEIRKEIFIPGSQSLDLSAAEAWKIEVDAPGFWSPPHLYSPNTGEDRMALKLIPTTEIRGFFRLETTTELPATAEMRFKYHHTTSRESTTTATRKCALEFPFWSCSVPRGRLDLRLKAEGFVPHYYWEVDVDQPLDFGRTVIKRGNSLFGRVATADDSPIGDDCEVAAAPLSALMPDSRTKERLRSKTTTSLVDPRGFFHITELDEGTYGLTIKKPGWSPLETGPLLLKSNVDLELAETLILSRPVALTIAVQPALDSNGGTWALRLAESDDGEIVASEPVAANGIWKKPGLAPVDYSLWILDSVGNSVYHDSLSLTTDSNEFTIQLDTVLVEGTITLGDTPLVADLQFGGRHGAVSVKMSSDELGQFTGILPRDGYWSLDIEGKSSRIHRRLPRVQVGPAIDGTASLDITLPDTLIQGEVVYEDNRPASDAKIVLMPVEIAERVTSADADESGFFELRGQAPGHYRIEAHSRGSNKSVSDTVTGEVKKSQSWTGIKLVLRESITLRGRVVSALSGQAVPGALVLPETVPGQPDQVVIMPQGRTNENGFFSFDLPRRLRQVDLSVLAVGFLLEKVNVKIGENGNQVTIPLAQDGGGSLRLKFNTSNQGLERVLDGERFPVVYSDRMLAYSLNFLRLWARMHGTPFRGEDLVIPKMQPGIYYVCWIPPLEVTSTAFDISRAGTDCEGEILSPGDEVLFREPSPG